MSTTPRTIKATNARIDTLEAKLDQILAYVEPKAPAKTRKTTARKPARKPAAPKRTAQPKADLGRKGWNRALTALARSKGALTEGTSVYAYVLEYWTEVQSLREQGKTPAEALEFILAV